MRIVPVAALFLLVVPAFASAPAFAQFGPGGPPAVGVAPVQKRAVRETSDFVGRVQAVNKVDIIARVTAFVAERDFTEGDEVGTGALLYRLERGPFEADLAAKQASVQQIAALLRNAAITLGRARSLLSGPAGQRSTVDDGEAAQASQAAQLLAAQAQLKQSQINLDYTEIRAPFAGKMARSTVTVGNVVGPNSGALTTIVSQDPIYVLFPVSLRAALDLRNRYAAKGGFEAIVVHVKLSDGTMYARTGKLDYVDPSVSTSTDTVNLRAVMPNPLREGAKAGDPGNRDLIDGEFVSVTLEGAQPVQVLAVPRVAILSDQQGSYVYIVDADNKAQIRRVVLGQSTAQTAVILSGVSEGDSVISEGLQRVRPGAVVNPGPAAPRPPGPNAPASPPAAAPAAAPKG